MRVDLNSELVLGNGNFYITDIDGLGAADIRTSDFLFSGRDGGLVTDQYYGFRNIDVSGKIVSDTCEQHQTERDELIAATPIGSTFPVYVTLFTGASYVIYCRVVKVSMPYNAGGKISDYLVQLRAGDPLFYSLDGGETQSAALMKVVETGGYVTPYILPVEWEAGGAPTAITNNGNAVYYPRITLYDEAANPSVENLATGEIFELDLDMVDGDEVVIDMLNRTVTLNGSDIIGNKTAESTWWGLLPGLNPIALRSDAADDTLSGLIEWRNGLIGV